MTSTEEPTHETKPEIPPEILALTPQIERMLEDYHQGLTSEQQKITPIHVDEIASKIAKFYEMVRKVIDWKEDNVLRRSATERILKRLFFPKISGVETAQNIDFYQTAYIVSADLIRGGHLPNDEIAQEQVKYVELALKKYFYLLQNAHFVDNDPLIIKRKINFTTFTLEVAACEIEEILTHPVKEKAIIQAMTESLSDLIRVIPDKAITESDLKMYTYIATCRTLYDLDDNFIIYQLLKFSYPYWQNPNENELPKLAEMFPKIWLQKDQALEHPLARQFYAICERIDTVFLLIADILEQNKKQSEKLKSIFTNKTELTKQITEAYDKRYQTLKTRLVRLAIFSTLSVFLSNWFTFYIIEVPAASIFYEGFNWFTAFIDFLIPTVTMFVLVAIIRPPAGENLERVLQSLYRFTYQKDKKIVYEVRSKPHRNRFFAFLTGFLYFVMMFLVFGGIGYIFYIAHLPITSVAFDTFTIALTIFAAVMIRNKSRELVVDERQSVWEFILDMFSVPIAKIGSFLAAKWKEYNIVAILFTFLIETPFVVIVDFVENWSQYLKEKRSELH